MEGLQRSVVSFRRSGSSGLVWDDKLVNAELNKQDSQQPINDGEIKETEQETATASSSSRPAGLTIDRSRSNGGRVFRTGKVSPNIEPPSPKLSACACCGPFGKKSKTRRRVPKSGKRVM